MTPGPTPRRRRCSLRSREPVIHHRGPDSAGSTRDCLDAPARGLPHRADVLLFGASGTGAMESAVANLCSPGEPRARRLGRLLRRALGGDRAGYGGDVDHLRYDWGEMPRPTMSRARLGEREANAVFLTHSETSTGVVADVQRVRRRRARRRRAHRRRRGLEPGRRAAGDRRLGHRRRRLGLAEGADDAARPRHGLRLRRRPGRERDGDARRASTSTGSARARRQAKLDAPFTPRRLARRRPRRRAGPAARGRPRSGLRPPRQARPRLPRGLKAMGLELFSPDDDRSAVVTAVRAPEGIDSDELVLVLRDRHGVTLAPGQGGLKGKIFRIGHIGYYDVFDITTALAAVELALAELGAESSAASPSRAALEAFEHTARVTERSGPRPREDRRRGHRAPARALRRRRRRERRPRRDDRRLRRDRRSARRRS